MSNFLPSSLLSYFNGSSTDLVRPMAKQLSPLANLADLEEAPLETLVRLVHGDPSNPEHTSSQERLHLNSFFAHVPKTIGDVDVTDHDLGKNYCVQKVTTPRQSNNWRPAGLSSFQLKFRAPVGEGEGTGKDEIARELVVCPPSSWPRVVGFLHDVPWVWVSVGRYHLDAYNMKPVKLRNRFLHICLNWVNGFLQKKKLM